MIQKMLLTLLGLLILTIFNGCSWCEKIIYVPEVHEVKVPVPCKVPDVHCSIDQNHSNAEAVVDLVECIVDLRKAEKVCK